ncbi:MAG: tripartite tricarboxylate transporter TctB family protein [Hyphomicrobiaceae bacterium]|nr:tripartite tricarboxylate transporter TctB family protein [Hyphomicrobiaceae bacterium]
MALALLASGAFFASLAALLDFGRVGLPGPAFFPFALGIALCLLAGAILYQVWRGASGSGAIFLGHRDVVIAMLAMAGLAFAFERIDSYVVLGAFTAVLLILIARAAIWRVLLGVVLGMVAVWLFFGMALGVQLPTGDFWGLLTAWPSFGQP